MLKRHSMAPLASVAVLLCFCLNMAANTANVTSAEQALDLNNIRSVLQRMEAPRCQLQAWLGQDSIIFSLIERSQYRVNSAWHWH